MNSHARLLGFAFANADFLFEIDSAGGILFAAGATRDITPLDVSAITGTNAGELFSPSSKDQFRKLAGALGPGKRSGPHRLILANGTAANLALFRLPLNGTNISCTLALSGNRASLATDAQTGIASREAFLEAAAKAGGSEQLSLLDLPNLAELCASLAPEKAEALLKRVGQTLLTSGATKAGRLSETSFGALAPKSLGDLGLAERMKSAFSAESLPLPDAVEARIGLEAPAMTVEQRLLSLRYVIDQMTQKKKMDLGRSDIKAAFSAMVEQTETRLTDMLKKLDKGAFKIAYQPIKDLKDDRISHYEALARFDTAEGTGETVKFIESLGVSNAFDLAVASKVMSLIAQRSDVEIAFNVSGGTISSPESFALLAAILEKHKRLSARALIEITETQAIQDLESAGRAITQLRFMGYRVGLDDFGAGAASINYLHAFKVDFVKFDGALIKKMGRSEREDALLAGMAKLCNEMNLITIAEWIEDEAMAKAALAMGFRHGQGRWLGAPKLDMPYGGQANIRRRGVQESWG